MNCLLLIDSLTAAGAQRQLVNLAIGLRLRGHRVTVLTYAPKDFFLDRLLEHGVEHVNLKKQSRWTVRPVLQVLVHLRRLQPDVLITFLRTPSVYAELSRLIRPSTRLIVSERSGVDIDGFSRADSLAGIGHRLAHRLVTNSHDFLSHLVAAHPGLRQRSSVIYNGLDERYFSARQAARVSRPDPDGVTRFCVVAARATRQKAPAVMVEALGLLRQRGIDAFRLHWIGPVDHDSPLVKKVLARLEALQLGEQWRWCGASSDTAAVYPEYDALVSPSLFEGVSNTMCEALCAGLPVIATDIADNRLILEGGGTRVGLVCPPDDPAGLADALANFISMPAAERRQLADASHARARELFDATRFVDRWEALCHEVCRGTHNHPGP